MSYLDTTIDSYNADPQGYMERTKELRLDNELQEFISGLAPDAVVLDAGCAGGRDSAYFVEQGVSVIGIDLSDGLLAEARKAHPSIEFTKADVRTLPFADDSFDAIWCHAVLLHLEDDDISTALAEFKRVLKTEGKAFISFKLQPDDTQTDQSFTTKGERYFNYQTPQSVTNLFVNAGFSVKNQKVVNEASIRKTDREISWIFTTVSNV